MKGELALHDYTKTPEYQKAIVQPFKDLQELAETIQKGNPDLKEDAIIDAVTSRNYEQVKQTVLGMKDYVDEWSMSQIIRIADSVQTLYRKEAKIAAEAEEKMTEYEKRRESELSVEAEKQSMLFQSSVDGVFNKFGGKIPILLNDEGKTSSNVSGFVEKAKAVDFGSMSVDNQAFAAMAAVLLPEMAKALKTANIKVADLEKLNSEYKGSSPNPKPSSDGGAGTGGTVDPQDVIAAFING